MSTEKLIQVRLLNLYYNVIRDVTESSKSFEQIFCLISSSIIFSTNRVTDQNLPTFLGSKHLPEAPVCGFSFNDRVESFSYF